MERGRANSPTSFHLHPFEAEKLALAFIGLVRDSCLIVLHHSDSWTRRAVAVSGAALTACVLVGGVLWHISELRARTVADVERSLASGARVAASALEEWHSERQADAIALADVAASMGATGADDGSAAKRTAWQVMAAMQRHADYAAVWLLSPNGRPLIATSDIPLTAQERAVARRAVDSASPQTGIPERIDSRRVVVPIVAPLPTGGASAKPAGVVLIRASVAPNFGDLAYTRRDGQVPQVIVRGDGAAQSVRVCRRPAPHVCLEPRHDSLATQALDAVDLFGAFDVPGGARVFAAAHRLQTLPWTAVRSIEWGAAFAPMRHQLELEAVVLLATLVGLTMLGWSEIRAERLRRLAERTQSEARIAAAGQQLNATAARFEALVQALDDIVVKIGRDGRIIGTFGQGVHRITDDPATLIGTRADALLGRSSREARDAERRAFDGATASYIVDLGQSTARRSYAVSVSPLRSESGQVEKVVAVYRDITAVRNAEISADAQRRVLEEIATGRPLPDVLTTVARFHETQAPDLHCAVHVLDDDGVMLNLLAAPSMRPEFADGMDEIVIGPRAAACGAAAYAGALVVTADISADRRWNNYRALADEQGYRSSWAAAVRGANGRVVGSIAVYSRERRPPSDAELRVVESAGNLAGIAIERARAVESLRKSENSFRSFVENSPIGIYRSTSRGRLLAANQALVQLLGYGSIEELLQVDLGKSVFARAEDRERVFRMLEVDGAVHGVEVDWLKKNGSPLTVRLSGRAFRDERNVMWFGEGFVEDVTPLRIAQEALRQSEKLAAVGQLVSGVAHELNNPIAAILHFSEDLLTDRRSAEDLEALTVIRDQARRSRSIVRDLLSFVRMRETRRDRVVLHDVLAATCRGLKPTVALQGAALEHSLGDTDVSVITDRAGLQQILTNLVTNASQAAGRGGTVYVRASTAANTLTLIVEDTGPGVPAELMCRIFEPFFTTRPLGEGTGLGLSVTLGIVQQLGGHIDVETRPVHEGGGARFVVTLPMQDPQRHTPIEGIPCQGRRQHPDVYPTATSTALVIDDEPSIRAALRRFFNRRGWNVDEAADGHSALRALLARDGQSPYAVVISDLKMPGFSGIELHDRIAETRPELLDAVIFSTGDVASTEAAEFVRRTRCPVLQKPFELQALESAVAHVRETVTKS